MDTLKTELTTEQLRKIPNGRFQFLNEETARHALNTEPANRPRIYGYLERGECSGQIVRLASTYQLEQHLENLAIIWVSLTSISDMIRPAHA